MHSSLYSDLGQITLCIYVDQSNVEVTTADGSVIMSTLVFPETIYDRISLAGSTVESKLRLLRTVWR
jgi:fructan beta-fructosidase